jgi:hypothetical protein
MTEIILLLQKLFLGLFWRGSKRYFGKKARF